MKFQTNNNQAKLETNGISPWGNNFDMCRFEQFIPHDLGKKYIQRRDSYLLMVILNGSGKHVVDFTKHDIQPDTITLLYPGQLHSWEKIREIEGYLIFFTFDFFAHRNFGTPLEFPFFSSIHQLPSLKIPEEDHTKIKNLLECMLEEFAHHRSDYLKALRSYLNILLIECKRMYHIEYNKIEEKDKHITLVVRNFEQLIETNFKEKRKVREYAEMLFLTPNYLNSVCNRVVGRSASELIKDRIMLEARRMLLFDNRPISEIGASLNFDDSSYFSRFFKRYEGLSPEKFRKHHLREK